MVARQVQRIRGLTFVRPVAPQPLSQAEIGRLAQSGLNQEFPAELEARRGKAWATIGAIPPGTDLHRAIADLGGSRIVGLYDDLTRRLVFVGGTSLSPFEEFTLAHELTHALQDQRFDLIRLDEVVNTCRDDRAEAFLSLVEGDAVETQVRWARTNLSATQLQQLQQEASSFPPSPASVPPFVQDLFNFPYTSGQRFVEALVARGGEPAVNEALLSPPTSTEQILHPSSYPSDVPTDVEVPNLARKLGAGWSSIDVQDVGEGWLMLLMGLRLPSSDAAAATGGWDGGQYRSWSDGSHIAVLMRTTWDSGTEAQQFAEAMGRWLGGGTALVEPHGSDVEVLFGSDQAALSVLKNAAG
jgi:hypothetical protein